MPAPRAAWASRTCSIRSSRSTAGAKYLRQMLDQFGGDIRKALAAYNAGPGAVQKYKGIPPYAETQNYVRKVLGFAEGYRNEAGAPAAPATAGKGGGLAYKTI
jgi:hypothetical protein